MLTMGVAILAAAFALQDAPAAPAARPQTPDAGPRQAAPTSTARPPATSPPAVRTPIRPATPSTTQQSPPTQAAPADCNGFPCDLPQPKVIPVNPPPGPAPWPWYQRIEWAAIVVLAILGYAGIMMAVSLLKKIERQTVAAEEAAEAAKSSAHAAMLNAQAIIDSERPWVLVTVEPSMQVENGFVVTAANRGRSPAQIVSTSEQVKIAVDESKLPKKSENDHREPSSPKVPIILLPGESIGLKTFSRADARGFCESDEQFARIESWEEKIYLIGRVTYRDLIAPPETQFHQTDWCCWYIHGRQKSGLVIAGPREYNLHT